MRSIYVSQLSRSLSLELEYLFATMAEAALPDQLWLPASTTHEGALFSSSARIKPNLGDARLADVTHTATIKRALRPFFWHFIHLILHDFGGIRSSRVTQGN